MGTVTIPAGLTPDHYLDLRDGQFDGTSRQDLTRLFAALAKDPNRQTIVIHFHGGLIIEQAGLDKAGHLVPFYAQAGSFPVCFVWQSGLIEALELKIRSIGAERFFTQLVMRVAQFAAAKVSQNIITTPPHDFQVQDEIRQPQDGAEPFADLSPSILPPSTTLTPREEALFRQTIETDAVLAAESRAIAGPVGPQPLGIQPATAPSTLMTAEKIQEIRDDLQAGVQPLGTPPPFAPTGLSIPGLGGVPISVVVGAVKILVRVIARFAKSRDHGLYCTVVEEVMREYYAAAVGQAAWSEMKKETEDAFRPDPAQYGGTAFLSELSTAWPNLNPRVILIGHSTGAVYICNWLNAVQQSNLAPNVVFDVVFLAPACRFDLLAATLKTHSNRIRNIRMFALDDQHERDNQLVPAVYTRSLLYFVSGVTEDDADTPIVGMQRFYMPTPPFNGMPDIQAVASYLGQPKREVWSIANDGPGQACASTAHGGFDQEPVTLQSLAYIIGKGF